MLSNMVIMYQIVTSSIFVFASFFVKCCHFLCAVRLWYISSLFPYWDYFEWLQSWKIINFNLIFVALVCDWRTLVLLISLVWLNQFICCSVVAELVTYCNLYGSLHYCILHNSESVYSRSKWTILLNQRSVYQVLVSMAYFCLYVMLGRFRICCYSYLQFYLQVVFFLPFIIRILGPS